MCRYVYAVFREMATVPARADDENIRKLFRTFVVANKVGQP